MNGIRAAKYAVRAASVVLELLILLIIAGPVVGAVSPLLGTQQQPLGVGVDLNSINSQLGFFNSGSTIVGNHSIVVPAFNRWPLPAGASLFLTIIANGQTMYQTQPDSVQLGPFQSGELRFTINLTSSLVAKLQGQKIQIGGTMSISEGQFFSVTVSFPQG